LGIEIEMNPQELEMLRKIASELHSINMTLKSIGIVSSVFFGSFWITGLVIIGILEK